MHTKTSIFRYFYQQNLVLLTMVPRNTTYRRYCLYSKYFVFRYDGYILACALGVRYCSYSRYSQYFLGLLSTRNILAASTSILSVLGLRFVLIVSAFRERNFLDTEIVDTPSVIPLRCVYHNTRRLYCFVLLQPVVVIRRMMWLKLN